jgi:hypothetical protein
VFCISGFDEEAGKTSLRVKHPQRAERKDMVIR